MIGVIDGEGQIFFTLSMIFSWTERKKSNQKIWDPIDASLSNVPTILNIQNFQNILEEARFSDEKF